jgi:hypothetical protein
MKNHPGTFLLIDLPEIKKGWCPILLKLNQTYLYENLMLTILLFCLKQS